MCLKSCNYHLGTDNCLNAPNDGGPKRKKHRICCDKAYTTNLNHFEFKWWFKVSFLSSNHYDLIISTFTLGNVSIFNKYPKSVEMIPK